MSDTKMLQAIIKGQSSMKEELLNEIKKLNNNLSERIDVVDQKVTKNGKRIDKLGKSLAYLEDDAPTWEEHDKLEKRVTKLEHKIALVD